MLKQLEGKELVKNPVTVCVLGVLATVFLSHAARLDFIRAGTHGMEFLKIVLYFLLLLAVINSKRRLTWFLFAIVGFTIAINILAVLQYYGHINIESLTAYAQNEIDVETGERYSTLRMRATGMFGDPNDLSMIIVAALMICGGSILSSRFGMARFLLAAPAGFLVYALTLTQSRGGFLALLAGSATLLLSQFGWKKAMIPAIVIIPLLALWKGRQTDIGGAMSNGTGESRTGLWHAGLQLFKESPVVGIGYDRYREEAVQVAHNSYLHTTTELGFFGGMFFLGVFAIPGSAIRSLISRRAPAHDRELQQLMTVILSLLVAYGVSMLSLSRCYVVPTYLVAGLAAVSLKLAAHVENHASLVAFNGGMFGRLAMLEAAAIAGIHIFIQATNAIY